MSGMEEGWSHKVGEADEDSRESPECKQDMERKDTERNTEEEREGERKEEWEVQRKEREIENGTKKEAGRFGKRELKRSSENKVQAACTNGVWMDKGESEEHVETDSVEDGSTRRIERLDERRVWVEWKKLVKAREASCVSNATKYNAPWIEALKQVASWREGRRHGRRM